MATKTSTTAPRAMKAPFWNASYYGLQFIALLNAWGEHIHAEQALTRTRAADPGARRALAWAESALPKFHDTLLNTLEAIPAEPGPAPAPHDDPARDAGPGEPRIGLRPL